MKGKPIGSVLLFLFLNTILLKAHAESAKEAIVEATTNKGEGILVEVDTVFVKKWQALGMRFRFYRSIKGVNDYMILDEKWGTYQKFDVTATPGIWYEYKVEVLEKGGARFFLKVKGPVEGFRPPSSSKVISTDLIMAKPYQYRGEIYIDFYFKGENGGWILPNGAVYNVKYKTQEKKAWMFDLGKGPLHPVFGEIETRGSRFKFKKRPGMESIEICIRMIQKGRLSPFFCTTVDLDQLPHKWPKDIALLKLSRPMGKALFNKPSFAAFAFHQFKAASAKRREYSPAIRSRAQRPRRLRLIA